MLAGAIGSFMITILRMLVMPCIKLTVRVILFTGLYWFCASMGVGIVYELITGGNSLQDPIISQICSILWYGAYVVTPLTFVQNIVRLVKRDNSFNIFKLIYAKLLGVKNTIGTQAKSSKENTAAANNVHGVVFGKDGGKYYVKDEQEKASILVIGGTRSGKTTGIVIPTLKSWQGGIFAVDIKGELYQTTAHDRDINYVKKFNPCDASAYGYDPFYPLKTARNIVQEVKNIALSIIPPVNDGKDKFWTESAQDFLCGAILFYYDFGLNFSEVMLELKTKPAQETIALIMESTNEKAKAKMAQFIDMPRETLGGIYAELSNNIDIFATDDDLIHALSGQGACITPEDLENGYDIYCCINEDLVDQWRPLMTLMCNQFFKFFEKRSLESEKPILFILDEFPRLGKIDSITNGLSTLAGRNVNLALIIQSKAQLDDVYGKDKATIIADNCGYKAIIKATDPDTQKWCAELVGKYDKEKMSNNYNADIFGIGKGTGTGRTTEQRYIIEPSEFGYLAEKDKLVLLAPTGYKVLNKIKWWEDNTFTTTTQQKKGA